MAVPKPADIARERQAREALLRWGRDPVLFSREVLGFAPWEQAEGVTHGRAGQADVLRALATHNFIACRSGHKCGKTSLAASAALWFVVTRPGARVIITAPSGHQVQNVVWNEVRNLYRNALIPLGGEIFDTAHVGLRFNDGRQVFGLSTDVPERFAGLSGANLLFIVDEASGIDERIFEAVFGNSAGGATVLLLSNPTRTSGTFYDAFHERADNWKTFHISSLDTPPMRGVPCPGLATRSWIDFAVKQWGEDSPFYDVRVRGEFPSEGVNNVIGLSLIEQGRARWQQRSPYDAELGPLSLGNDVARFGDDDSVIAPVRGFHAYGLDAFKGLDTVGVAARVRSALLNYRAPNETPRVNVDVIGVGAGVVDTLKAPDQYGAPSTLATVTGVNVSSKSFDPKHYANLRAELWFNMRSWLREGGALPPDEALAAELIAPTFSYDPSGRLLVEPKGKIKARLRRSPDRADALALALYKARALPSLESLDKYRARLPRLRL